MNIKNNMVMVHNLTLSTRELKWIAHDVYNHMYSLSPVVVTDEYWKFAEQLRDYAEGFNDSTDS